MVGSIVLSPSLDSGARLRNRIEPVLIQAVLSQPTVERLDAGVVRWFPWPAELQLHVVPMCPGVKHLGDEFRAVVDGNPFWQPVCRLQSLQDGHNGLTGNRAVDLDRWTNPTKGID